MSFAAFGFLSFVAFSQSDRGAPNQVARTAAETQGQASGGAGEAARKVSTPRRIYPPLPQEQAETPPGTGASVTASSAQPPAESVPLPRPRPSEAPQSTAQTADSPAVSEGAREPQTFSLTRGASTRTDGSALVLEGAKKETPSAASQEAPNAPSESAAATAAEARKKAERQRSAQRARQRANRQRQQARRQPVEQEFPQYTPFWGSPYAYVTPDGRRAPYDRGFDSGRRAIPTPPGSWPY